jgi:hypothetical protein
MVSSLTPVCSRLEDLRRDERFTVREPKLIFGTSIKHGRTPRECGLGRDSPAAQRRHPHGSARGKSIAALRSRSEQDTEPGRRLRRISAELNTGQTDGAGNPLI